MKELLIIIGITASILGGLWLIPTGKEVSNIEHDGHLFIQSRRGLLHHPACSCQSSLKAIRASQP